MRYDPTTKQYTYTRMADPTDHASQHSSRITASYVGLSPRESSFGEAEFPIIEAEPDVNMRKTYLLIVALVIVETVERVLLMIMLKKMKNYGFFLAQFIALLFIPTMFLLFWLSWRNSPWPFELSRFPKSKFAIMGGFDAVGALLILIPGGQVNSSLATLIMQGVVPFTMLFSVIFLRKRFRWLHLLASLMVVAGVAIGVVADVDVKGSTVAAIGYTIVLLLSNIPISLANIYKEVAMKRFEFDVFYLNGWVALFQFLFGLPVAPLAFYLQSPNGNLKDLPRNFIDACYCLAGRTDSQAGDEYCDYSYAIVAMYLVVLVVFNVVTVLILREGSASLLVTAMTVSVPLSYFAFAIPHLVPGETTQLMWMSAPALTLTVGGLLLYNYGGDPLSDSTDLSKEAEYGDNVHDFHVMS